MTGWRLPSVSVPTMPPGDAEDAGTPIRPGSRFTLPSGRVVEVLTRNRSPRSGPKSDVFDCGYLHDGEVMPPGYGLRNRVALTRDWLLANGSEA